MRETKTLNRRSVLEGILRFERNDQPMNAAAVRNADPSLYHAACKQFGCWSSALKSAGINADSVSKKRKWDLGKIVHHIRELHRRGYSLKPSTVSRRDRGLYCAGIIHFGSWANSLVAAGIDPNVVSSRLRLDRDTIIECILMRALKNEPLELSTVSPPHLKSSAIAEFGSWTGALEAAGLDPSVYVDESS